MSDTYKDKKRYTAKHYFDGYRELWRKFYNQGIKLPPQPKDLSEPEWWNIYRYYAGNDGASYWLRLSNKRSRKKVKRLISQGRYDETKYIKPENVDYIIS